MFDSRSRQAVFLSQIPRGLVAPQGQLVPEDLLVLVGQMTQMGRAGLMAMAMVQA